MTDTSEERRERLQNHTYTQVYDEPLYGNSVERNIQSLAADDRMPFLEVFLAERDSTVTFDFIFADRRGYTGLDDATRREMDIILDAYQTRARNRDISYELLGGHYYMRFHGLDEKLALRLADRVAKIIFRPSNWKPHPAHVELDGVGIDEPDKGAIAYE